VSPVKYELGFYIPEVGIFNSHRRENLKSYIALTGWTLYRRRNVSPVKYELGSCIPEDNILHSHRRENLKSYTAEFALTGHYAATYSTLVRTSFSRSVRTSDRKKTQEGNMQISIGPLTSYAYRSSCCDCLPQDGQIRILT
jgi:hypothetical protein